MLSCPKSYLSPSTLIANLISKGMVIPSSTVAEEKIQQIGYYRLKGYFYSFQRNDFLQKLSTSLIRENQTICVENLKIQQLMKNYHLAKSISDVAWSSFFRMLEYKSQWYGNQLIKVPTFYPSSQKCHVCGIQNPDIKNLKIRDWECPVCHTRHNRDINAALNILNKGLESLA